MLTNDLYSFSQYKHVETGRICTIHNPTLFVKTDRHWQQCVQYSPDDRPGAMFAVPIDDFRQRFTDLD